MAKESRLSIEAVNRTKTQIVATQIIAKLARAFADDVQRDDQPVSLEQCATMLRTAAGAIDILTSIAWPDEKAA